LIKIRVSFMKNFISLFLKSKPLGIRQEIQSPQKNFSAIRQGKSASHLLRKSKCA